MTYRFITVEGNIGAGKTTLSKMLAESMKAKILLETFDNNPFLPKLFEDFKRHAFAAEMFFMAERFQQLNVNLEQGELFSESVISDFLFAKSRIFSEINLDKDEFALYRRLFETIYSKIPLPNLLLYVYQPIPKLLRQISERGRAFENQYNAEYLAQIQKGYFQYFREVQDLPVLILNCENADFKANKDQYQQILNLCQQKHQPGIHHITIT